MKEFFKQIGAYVSEYGFKILLERMSDEITDEPIADESKEKKHK